MWRWIKKITRTAAVQIRKNSKLLGTEESYRLFHPMLKELPGNQRLVLFEYYYNAMEISEISELYGVSEVFIECMLTRARKILEEKLWIYQKEKGRHLYVISAEEVFGMLFQEEIRHTKKTAALPPGSYRTVGSAEPVRCLRVSDYTGELASL